MTVPRHSLAIGAVAAFHAGLLAILLTSTIHAAPAATPASIAIRAVPSALAVIRVAPPAPLLTAITADIPMPVVDTETSAENCTLAGIIAAALGADREVGASLAAQTNVTALMVWDGGWSSDPTPAIAPIRRVVVDQIRSSSASCRSTAMVGPRLLMVPAGPRTVAVAIGSGTWTWQQLLS
ncbi:hypothetical protein KZX46_20005 [Polymorphobacter sp. PAMC 29334]|uniref:hypothetical protein n=1 Tax=Polymorphobacter sp. PAMC 29334 TaxID=2862331 RepID=UPI001C799DA0|nr:hypothetical protein [Polymorphobacter sp. PAMC 29334]QYE34980.1 hypothetical protein KZX46_20005 [Polymorphobacter sp. PAMC 29334]